MKKKKITLLLFPVIVLAIINIYAISGNMRSLRTKLSLNGIEAIAQNESNSNNDKYYKSSISCAESKTGCDKDYNSRDYGSSNGLNVDGTSKQDPKKDPSNGVFMPFDEQEISWVDETYCHSKYQSNHDGYTADHCNYYGPGSPSPCDPMYDNTGCY